MGREKFEIVVQSSKFKGSGKGRSGQVREKLKYREYVTKQHVELHFDSVVSEYSHLILVEPGLVSLATILTSYKSLSSLHVGLVTNGQFAQVGSNID